MRPCARLPTGGSFLRKPASPLASGLGGGRGPVGSPRKSRRGHRQRDPGTGESREDRTRLRDLEHLPSIKPRGGNRGKPRKPGAPGGTTLQMTSWKWVWTNRRGHRTSMKGPGPRPPRTSTSRKLLWTCGGRQRSPVSRESFSPQSWPRRDVPPKDKPMPGVWKTRQGHRSRPRCLRCLRGPGRAAAEPGPSRVITRSPRTLHPPPRTPGGRTLHP